MGAIPSPERHQTACCIVGGGPAGMMLGFLLARAGVTVTVLEKHADFNRDFRGDTIHPSTLELMHELGLLQEFLRLPHQEQRVIAVDYNGQRVPLADCTHLPTRCKFIALMPQWDFLNFLSGHANKFPAFTLRRETRATELLTESGRVVGVRAVGPDGVAMEVRAQLVVSADGRHSAMREQSGLELIDRQAPIDVLWMRLSRKVTDPEQTIGVVKNGRMLVLLDRREYWQGGFIIVKGAFDEMRRGGLPAFQELMANQAPFLRDRVSELDDWAKVKLLTVQINRLRDWARPGLLCIGDAAHAMSPAGGVGINLAIQDAVATANLLAAKLGAGRVELDDLRAVQRRREWPTRVIQAMQVFVHRNIVTGRPSEGPAGAALPLPLQVFRAVPFLRRFPARFLGMGPRPEHIRSPLAAAPSSTDPERGLPN